MVSVPTNNYYSMVYAAQLQAARTGMQTDGKQTISVAVQEQALPPAPQNPNAAVSRIVDVLV